jgi:cell division protein FtsB
VDLRVIIFEKILPFARRHARELVILGFLLLILHDIFGPHGVLAMRRSIKEAEHMRQDLERLNEENRRLQDHVKALKTDPQTIEGIARDEMGLARPGEYIFKLPVKSADPATAPQPKSTTAPADSPKK